MTARFKWLLSEQGHNQKSLAATLNCGLSHLNQVLNNHPGRGGQTRRKVAKWVAESCGEKSAEMLKELGWDAAGNMVPQGTSHVEQQGEALTHGLEVKNL